VVWAKPMSAQKIAMVKTKDAHDKKVLIDRSNAAKQSNANSLPAAGKSELSIASLLFEPLRRWWGQ
jgi:hypothetical protein